MQPLFGTPLPIALSRSSHITSDGHAIPGVLAVCYHEIEKRGLDTEGLFRKSGSAAIANQLQIEFEKRHDPFAVKIPQQISSHSIAGVFKRYLQLLPEPVIPLKHQRRFLQAFDERVPKEALKKRLKDICKSLPHEHLHLFQFLICVVDRIQKNQNNQMTIESLAIIFAPTCIGIDGMGDLIIKSPSIKIQSSSSSNNNNKQVFQRARSVIWNTIRKKTLTTKKCPFESPSLGQMSAVKEITTWIKIFQFFMTYPQIFGNLTGHRINKSFSFNERNNMPQSTLNMCSFLNNKKIDTSKLEFAGSRDIIKTFESMNMELSLASTSFSCINILSN